MAHGEVLGYQERDPPGPQDSFPKLGQFPDSISLGTMHLEVKGEGSDTMHR